MTHSPLIALFCPDALFRTAIAELLEADGWSVKVAPSAEALEQLALSCTPDLFLLDGRAPANVSARLSALLRTPRLQHLPVVVLTAAAQQNPYALANATQLDVGSSADVLLRALRARLRAPLAFIA